MLLAVAALVLAACVPQATGHVQRHAPRPHASQPAPQKAAPAPAQPVATPPAEGGVVTGDSRLFAADSPWNTPVAAGAQTASNSSAVVAKVASSGGKAKLYEYGYPVFHADENTPRYNVRCTKYGGNCAFKDRAVPVPDGASPNQGSDGAMVVIDWSERMSYSFFQARTVGGGWEVSWGSVNAIDGHGHGNGGSGSGLARMGGVVRTSEIEAGSIDHALSVSVNNVCKDDYVWPASKTDGWSTASDCVKAGARFQLDPKINLAAVPGITPAELAVGRALQTYGAYVVDGGGSKLAVNFEKPTSGVNPYPSAGLAWDYYTMGKIPWGELRLLDE